MVGVAVNVFEEPVHEGLVPDVSAIETEGTIAVLIDIVILLEVAVSGLAQFALEVNTQVTTWPFVIVVLEKVELLVPVFTPFSFH